MLARCKLKVALDAIEPAFVHDSGARESALESNERLEFLGDGILGFVAARWLFERHPKATEGELHRRRAAFVNAEALATTARRLGFGNLMVLGAGEHKTGGRDRTSILADAFEAFLAALYHAKGLETVTKFLEREHLTKLERHVTLIDPKTELQELVQARTSAAPVYLETAEGRPHERVFTSHVSVEGEVVGVGTGPSKKAAQQNAALQALATLRKRDAS
ncbi:MAG TPA: ribonuclease III [Candidatus Acidoferrales bacterium]|nr:ribonuclease III [Candidatus Acidoferrales bacterium]